MRSVLVWVAAFVWFLAVVVGGCAGCSREAAKVEGKRSYGATLTPGQGGAVVLAGTGDGPHIDAFSRLRVSGPTTLFNAQQQYGDDPEVWENQFFAADAGADGGTDGGPAAVNLLNESTVQLTTGGTARGNAAFRQTLAYWRYEPGKSQYVNVTFVFDGGPVDGVHRAVGYFDSGNGVFLEQDGSVNSICLRTSTSGSAVDNCVAQANWNEDTMPATGPTGPSGVRLDLSKAQILVEDLQWLSAGRVRVGFNIDGRIVYAHQFLNANVQTKAYMSTANLPVRFEISNTAAASSVATMRAICATVISEGGTAYEQGKQRSANNARGADGGLQVGTTVSALTEIPIFSVRAGAAGPNGVRNSSQIRPKTFDVVSTGSAGVSWSIVLNATLTGASFAPFNTSTSVAEVDTSATAFSGGTVLDSGEVPSAALAKSSTNQDFVVKDLVLSYSGLLGNQDTLTVVAGANAATTTAYASVTWLELW